MRIPFLKNSNAKKLRRLLEKGKRNKAHTILEKMVASGEADIAREIYDTFFTAVREDTAKNKRQTTREDAVPSAIKLLEENASTAIRLYRPYPPSPPHHENSYLGGLPMLPPGIDWPETRGDADDYERLSAMHFLGQIDLSELPSNDQLPNEGALYFFANLNGPAQEGSEGTKVIFAETFSNSFLERQPPDNLYKRLSNPSKASDWRLFPKWPIRFFESPSFRQNYSYEFYSEMADRFPGTYNKDIPTDEHDFWEVYQEEGDKRSTPPEHVEAEIGQTSPSDPEWLAYIKNDGDLIFPRGFPFCGELIHSLAKEIIYFVDDKISQYESSKAYGQQDFKRKLEAYESGLAKGVTGLEKPSYERPEEIYGRSIIDDLKSEALSWQKIASEIGAKTQPTDEHSDLFLDWLRNVGQRRGPKTKDYGGGKLTASYIYTYGSIQSAVMESVKSLFQKSVSDVSFRKLIPDHYYADMAQHRLHQSHLKLQHQLLGHAPLRGNPITIGENDILLLNLFSDYGMNFMFGDVDEMQFYIDKDDLAARRFDKAWGRAG